jgi:hypothetical protein
MIKDSMIKREFVTSNDKPLIVAYQCMHQVTSSQLHKITTHNDCCHHAKLLLSLSQEQVHAPKVGHAAHRVIYPLARFSDRKLNHVLMSDLESSHGAMGTTMLDEAAKCNSR